MPRKMTTLVTAPTLGLYFDRPHSDIYPQALQDGHNFRITKGHINNLNLGWTRFSDDWTLDGPVLSIINFFPRGQGEKLVFLTGRDAYLYDTVNDAVDFLAPIYDTGTASANGTAVTGTGTDWDPNAQVGDFISFGLADQTNPNPTGNDSFTKINLHMDGADASTTFTDTALGASAGRTWTAAGNAQIDTAQSKFGGASGLFDGTGDWISTPDVADFNLAASNFTIDFWAEVDSDGTTYELAGQTDAGATAAGSSFYIQRVAGGTMRLFLSDGTSVTQVSAGTFATADGLVHFEFVRNGNVLTGYKNGVAGTPVAFTGTVPNVATSFFVGSRIAGGVPWPGHIDEFTLSVGVARHTAAFTAPTEAYASAWFEIQARASDTSITLTSTTGGVSAGSGPYTIRNIFHASKTNNWDYDIFVRDGVSGNDQLVITNGVDYVHSWDGIAAQMVEQSAMAFKCKRVLSYKNMMLYANLTDQGGASKPMDLINSAVGSPFLAGATGTGLSEQFVTHDGQDEILALRKLGDMAVVYSERHCVPAMFVGDPLVFVFREAAIDIGPIGSYCIADFGDYHEFIGLDTMYSFDGVTLRDINNHVAREMIRRMDPTRKRNVIAHFNEEDADVYWAVPETTDAGLGDIEAACENAWGEHYLEPVPDWAAGLPFSRRDFPFSAAGNYKSTTTLRWDTIGLTWDEATQQWTGQQTATNFPLQLMGDDDGIIWIFNNDQQANGAAMPSFIHTGRMATQNDGRGRGMVRRVYPFTSDGFADLSVSLYGAEHRGEAEMAIETQTLEASHTSGEDHNYFVSFFRRTRFFALEFGTSGGPWELEGWDYDLTKGGT